MEETKELITTDDIRSKVYIIRGQQVMLDKDLAEIYGYEVKKLNQQVKRNIERFPEDFMFRLSNSEIDSVRSQIVTSRKYPSLQIKPNPDCHDRLIVLDYGEETELVYHCGASSKDAGKKLCAINQITETAIIHPVIDRLLLLPNKQI